MSEKQEDRWTCYHSPQCTTRDQHAAKSSCVVSMKDRDDLATLRAERDALKARLEFGLTDREGILARLEEVRHEFLPESVADADMLTMLDAAFSELATLRAERDRAVKEHDDARTATELERDLADNHSIRMTNEAARLADVAATWRACAERAEEEAGRVREAALKLLGWAEGCCYDCNGFRGMGGGGEHEPDCAQAVVVAEVRAALAPAGEGGT